MAVTMSDIARQSGVSRSTVSLVLNNRGTELRISAEVEKRVLAAAAKLGFVPNLLARSVATGKSRVLAYVAENCSQSEYTGQLQFGVAQSAAASDYAVKLLFFNGNSDELVRHIQEWRIGGVLFQYTDFAPISDVFARLRELGVPAGCVNLSVPVDYGVGVTSDDAAGAYGLTRHMIERGARSLVCLTSPVEHEYIVNRRDGFLRAAAEDDCRVKFITFDTDMADRQDKILQAELLDCRPDAFFAVNDIWALAVLRAAWQLNIKVPAELLICGFGNLSAGYYSPIPISSVDQGFMEMGRRAACELINCIEGGSDDWSHHAINIKTPTKIMVRTSSER